jgi:hypothetical protein
VIAAAVGFVAGVLSSGGALAAYAWWAAREKPVDEADAIVAATRLVTVDIEGEPFRCSERFADQHGLARWRRSMPPIKDHAELMRKVGALRTEMGLPAEMDNARGYVN